MDHELKNLVLNINQLAALSGLHRQTVVARLKNIRPAGGHDKLKLYRLTDILTEFMGLPPPVAEGEMDPHERKAWYQSERERLKFEQETAQLIPASESDGSLPSGQKRSCRCWRHYRIFWNVTVVCSLTAVSRVQSIIDDLRDQIALRVTEAGADDEEELQQEE